MSIDLGDPYEITVETRTSGGALVDTTSVGIVVTLPDGTSLASVAASRVSTGVYVYDFPTTMVGLHQWVATVVGAIAGTYADTFVVVGTSDTSIVSLSEVKEYLRIRKTDDDELLRRLALVATNAAESPQGTGVKWRRCTVTELLDADGGPIFLPPNVSSVSTVKVGGVTLAASGWVANLAHGLLYTTGGGGFLAGTQVVEVTYLIGGGRVPELVRAGVLELVRHLYDAFRGGASIPRSAESEWNPALGYLIPNRVAAMWAGERQDGFA